LVEIINERANTNPLMAHEVYSRLVLTEQRIEARRANRSRGHGASANAASRGAAAPMVLHLPPRARFPSATVLLPEHFWGRSSTSCMPALRP
jgi:hypothetical protein